MCFFWYGDEMSTHLKTIYALDLKYTDVLSHFISRWQCAAIYFPKIVLFIWLRSEIWMQEADHNALNQEQVCARSTNPPETQTYACLQELGRPELSPGPGHTPHSPQSPRRWSSTPDLRGRNPERRNSVNRETYNTIQWAFSAKLQHGCEFTCLKIYIMYFRLHIWLWFVAYHLRFCRTDVTIPITQCYPINKLLLFINQTLLIFKRWMI